MALFGEDKEPDFSLLRKRALELYDGAVQSQTLLESKPGRLRTPVEYLKVIERFRQVYLTCPASSKADDALFAVGELHQKMGIEYQDPQYFLKAVKTFTFLSNEYPSSTLSEKAAFSVAEIYLNDLRNPDAAREAFEDFLENYPGSPKVRNARARLEDLKAELRPKGKTRTLTTETRAPVGKDFGRAMKNDLPSEEITAATRQGGRLTSREGEHSLSNVSQTQVASPLRPALVKEARYWHEDGYTRLVVALDSQAHYQEGRLEGPSRVYLDIQNSRLSLALLNKILNLGKGVTRVRIGQPTNNVSRFVLEGGELKAYQIFTLQNPFRIVVDVQDLSQLNGETRTPPQGFPEHNSSPLSDELRVISKFESKPRPGNDGRNPERLDGVKNTELETPKATLAKKSSAAKPVVNETAKGKDNPSAVTVRSESKTQPNEGISVSTVASPKSDGTRSLIRTLGLKIGRIVIDAGHGGQDTGTVGPSGLMEKDLVLDISLKLRVLIEEKLGGEVILTREDDSFIPLERRTELANLNQADLFVSIHANSSRDRAVRGVETFFLDFTSSPNSEEVAARENASSQKTIFELQDLVKRIALREKIDESREFAQIIQKAVVKQIQKNPQTTNRGVKQAPFIVLIGAQMPSILTEVSFLSNPSDEKLLKSPNYRQKMAQAICNGIEDYTRNLGGIKTARNLR